MDTNCERTLTADEIIWVLNQTNIGHLGVCENCMPLVVPVYYSFLVDCNQITFYLKSKKSGLKMRCLHSNPHVCLEVLISVNGGYASILSFGLAQICCIGVDEHYNKIEEITICSNDISGKFIPHIIQ